MPGLFRAEAQVRRPSVFIQFVILVAAILLVAERSKAQTTNPTALVVPATGENRSIIRLELNTPAAIFLSVLVAAPCIAAGFYVINRQTDSKKALTSLIKDWIDTQNKLLESKRSLPPPQPGGPV